MSASRQWGAGIKRFIDMFASLVLLLAATPILLVAIVAIAVTSKGPVFYLDRRYGAGDSQFTCYKLRTMHVNQDSILKARGLSNVGDSGRLLVFKDDPRIGTVGRWIRRLSIDELPQLLNVLLGDMSLIGPRPLPLSMLASYPDIRRARSVVRPGISGLWQVSHRTKNASVLDMVDDDTRYIRTISLGLDLKIACLTVLKLLEPSIKESGSDIKTKT